MAGRGDDSTDEAAIRAASVIADGDRENWRVGMNRQRRADGFPLPQDRGRSPAPQYHALQGSVAAGYGRRAAHPWFETINRDRRAAPARVPRCPHSPSHRPSLGPAARLAPRSRGLACSVVTL